MRFCCVMKYWQKGLSSSVTVGDTFSAGEGLAGDGWVANEILQNLISFGRSKPTPCVIKLCFIKIVRFRVVEAPTSTGLGGVCRFSPVGEDTIFPQAIKYYETKFDSKTGG